MADVESEIGREIVDKAKRVLPGGTFGNYAAEVVIREGKGGRVWDENGKEYVDFLLGSGPMLVGHAHPEVNAAVQEQIQKGTTFFANNRKGIELAEAIVEAVPCAEQVRFVSSGSEADLYAMRAVRAYTRRDKILKFEGGYHGMSDYSLMSLAPKRSGNFPMPVPDSAGIPKNVRDDMIIAPFNDPDAVAGLVRDHKDELAGVIVEPFQRIRADPRHRPRADGGAWRATAAGRHPGADHRRAALVRCRLHRPADPRLPQHPERRCRIDAPLQRTSARARHPERRVEILH